MTAAARGMSSSRPARSRRPCHGPANDVEAPGKKASDRPEGHTTPDPASGSDFVLMDNPTQQVASSDACAARWLTNRTGPRFRRLQPKTSVGPGLVVVGGVNAKYSLQVSAADTPDR